jgi:3-oxoacyl-[acyl-carrier-protein] synthase II
MQLKRVVVTGLGALTPIGNNVKEYWEALIAGKSGAAPITYFDTENHKSKFACEVKNFNIEDYMDRKESRKLDKFAQYAIAVSDEAIKDAGITLENTDKHRIGVIWGAGIGGIQTFQEEVLYYGKCDGVPKFNPYFIPKMIADIAPAHVSMRNGYMGPNYTTVSACASSANALIDAYNYIRLGMCDVIISGGSEAAVTISGMGGFSSLHALSTRNESPETASRPFDATRDGFVLGEGAGAIVLEEYEHAKARGAKIYCEFGGGGMSSDAYHITAPHPEGIGVIAVMENTLRDAGMNPEDVDHINTHGTSTPLGDVAELKAISHVFKSHAKNININSTKSMTGHLLGAAGAIEAIASILAMQNSMVPPTINHTTIDTTIDPSLNLTLNKAQKKDIKVAMSNTFGFGGHNACVLFKKI